MLGVVGLAFIIALATMVNNVPDGGREAARTLGTFQESRSIPANEAQHSRPNQPTNALTLRLPYEQRPYRRLSLAEMTLPSDQSASFPRELPPREIPGRRIPETVRLSDLTDPDLPSRAVPLPDANTLSHWYYAQQMFGEVAKADGDSVFFAPQTVLVKFRDSRHVAALRVEQMSEVAALDALSRRMDVAFAELDTLEQRQFAPNDPQVASQWHHAVIHSGVAWNRGLGSPVIRIAIVDSPFQMDHPDLAVNTDPGWDVVTSTPVTSSSGYWHSTGGAGVAAAVINNNLGGAGAVNCRVLPINILGFIDEMYRAVIWSADHGVRLVNVSWSGGNSPSLNESAIYLKAKAGGILAMAGVNGTGLLSYTNQPNIYCISMTDQADNMQSRHGDHIDFAAPGYAVYTTTAGSTYATQTGTSFSTPLFCGVVAMLFSINPTLAPDEAVEILKTSAVDRGTPGWDQFYGWGRIDFGRAAATAEETLRITAITQTIGGTKVSTRFRPGVEYSLWKSTHIPTAGWTRVSNATSITNDAFISLTDPEIRGQCFYRIEQAVPQR